jgi:hypothetical protein
MTRNPSSTGERHEEPIRPPLSIEARFADAVRGIFDTHPDWSEAPVVLPRRTFNGDFEISEFYDSSYLARAAYNLKTGDLTVTLRSGELLKVSRVPPDYWDRLVVAPSKGTFFLAQIKPQFKVRYLNLSWFRRLRSYLKRQR